MMMKHRIAFALLLLMVSLKGFATPRASIVDTFNDAARGFKKSDVDRVDFNNVKPQGWDSPSFTRAADDLHNAVRQYNITTPKNPHNATGAFPPPPSIPTP